MESEEIFSTHLHTLNVFAMDNDETDTKFSHLLLFPNYYSLIDIEYSISTKLSYGNITDHSEK